MRVLLRLAFVVALSLSYGLAAHAVECDTTGEVSGQCSGEFDGSLYVVVKHNGVSWPTAKAAAEAMSRNGVTGHLVTITSHEEDDFVDALRRDARSKNIIGRPEVWAGGFQNPANEENAKDGWTWLNDEGPFPGDNNGPVYANWLNGEPNDNTGSASEQHLAIGLRNEDGWNDEGALGNIGGYIVEFDNTSDAQNCLEDNDGVPDGQFGIGGCNPSGVQIVELPNNLDGQLEGKFITQALVKAKVNSEKCVGEFVAPDPRVYQDPNQPNFGEVIAPSYMLDLADVFEVPADTVYLRPDTVGSPCLALIFGEANFNFADLTDQLPNGGVATVTQLPADVPGMFILANVKSLDLQPDLQFVPQAAYRTDDRHLLVEKAGSPFTNDVFNPSRQKTFQFSYYPLNTREVCLFIDPSLTPADGAPYFEAVLECTIDLAVEYFDALEQALFEAQPNLISPKFSDFSSLLNQARSKIKNAQWDAARTRLNALLAEVKGGTWNVDDRNDPGNLEMRLDNLLWRIDQLEQAEQGLN